MTEGRVLTRHRARRYFANMKTTISSKRRNGLSGEFGQLDRVEIERVPDPEKLDRGDYRLVRHAAPHNEGAIDWLLACPGKDFFVTIQSESTDCVSGGGRRF